MKITVTQDSSVTETQIHITCAKMSVELEEIISNLGLSDHTFAGKTNGEIFFVPMKDILYFESVDKKTFFYTNNATYECKTRLISIEENLKNSYFSRISKTVIANLKKLRSIKLTKDSKLVATLLNEEKLIVSRKYVIDIKNKLEV
ncbi:MAG: LytTR family transcriptional regulator DNA-binding domain-containing protein [Clostridia bacterium]|nr:LytTR family transcriptional regulator DNA-binding domain-containing protein [Clostridia bacterium]